MRGAQRTPADLMNLAAFPLFLVLLCGACWTLVYLDGIRLGLRDRTYAIPFWALALNFAWELLHSVLGYQQMGPVLQVWINAVWFLFDCGILYTYFRYGRQWFPQHLRPCWFMLWSLLGLGVAFVIQHAFIAEFGRSVGGAYGAFLQNLLMSMLFIGMLVERGGSAGQSMTIAVSKWVGTLAPTILFGVLGGEGFNGPNRFILVIGLLCSLFDLISIAILAQTKARERRGEAVAVMF